MYVDRFPLPLGLRHPVLCNLSGIYFRPTFYYQTFLGYNAPKTSWYLNRIERPPFGDAFLTLLMTKFRLKLEHNWFRLEEDENLLNSLLSRMMMLFTQRRREAKTQRSQIFIQPEPINHEGKAASNRTHAA